MSIKVPPQLPDRNPCKIAFVGEAPSSEEIVMRKPFVGPSGRVLNQILRAANLDRDEYLITNLFDEEAEDNDPEKEGWLKDPVRMAESHARLNEEITTYKPNVVVPLGGTAFWGFTGIKSLQGYRGNVTTATQIVPGQKLLPTYHPAGVIRNWTSLPMVVADFMRAAEEADYGPEISYPKARLFVEPEPRDILRLVDTCLAAKEVSIDIETGWGQITSIGFAPAPDWAMEVPFIDLRKPNKSYWPNVETEMAVWKAVKRICEAPNEKVGQNFMYDIFWLWLKRGVALRNYRHDTRLQHKVLYPDLPADLGNMSASYTRFGAYKMWGGKYQKNDTKKDG